MRQESNETIHMADNTRPSFQSRLRARLAELEVQAMKKGARPDADLLERLHAEEQQLSSQTRTERVSEQRAFEEMESQRAEMLSLKAECTAAVVPEEPAKEVERALRSTLPSDHSALQTQRLDDLLAALEREKGQVADELGDDSAALQVHRDTEELTKQLHVLEEATWRRSEQFQAVRRQLQEAGEAVAEIDDLHAQAAALEKENQILSRQQADWRRSQNLMLRLVEDSKPGTCALAGQAEVHKEPGHCMAAQPSSESLLKEVQQANMAMRQRIQELQDEKADLVRSHQGLEGFIRSRMTTIEAKLAGNPVSPYPPSP
ncbi:EFTUD2 [Symbiodinium pilosum]|uniref:EFTUD2 protein n=1 Tax=Symbiodinium pilosum TaxID=2952 RepID=A0A812Y1J4_SYMPI|nr:EFTUD2 [Symbiodinium pilosum]